MVERKRSGILEFFPFYCAAAEKNRKAKMSQVTKRAAPPPPPPTGVAGDDVDFTDIEKQAERLGEDHTGQISASSSAAHPFLSACMVLKMALGLYAMLTVVTPITVVVTKVDSSEGSAAQNAQHFTIFIFYMLLYVPVNLLYHAARIQEWWICVRAYGLKAESYLDMQLPISFCLFNLAVLVQFVTSIIEIYNGRLDGWVMGATSFFSFAIVFFAIIFILRQERLIVINNIVAR
jgi:hypothetical protein